MDQPIARTKKTPEQIAAIEEVQRATEAAMAAVISYIQSADTPTSEEAHAVIDTVLAERGCESPEGHIVSGGTQSAEPHETGTGTLVKGLSVVIDIYPRSKETGYFADMSRTVCVGAPSTELQRMYDTVRKAQDLATGMVRPGVQCRDIQNAVDQFFADSGYVTSGKGAEFAFAEGFVHGVGHGVGTDVHEAPRIGRKSDDVLEEGDVVTIEPGLYYKKVGGIRLEDMVLVTATGVRVITDFPREFQI